MIRIIGFGNQWRGDDAVGLCAASALRERLGAGAEVIKAEADGTQLLDLLEGQESVILIDAVEGLGVPGATIRLDLSAEPHWGPVRPCSTHAIGLADAVALARVMGRLPSHLVLYGIEWATLDPGAGLSDAAREGLRTVVEQVVQEVQRAASSTSGVADHPGHHPGRSGQNTLW